MSEGRRNPYLFTLNKKHQIIPVSDILEWALFMDNRENCKVDEYYIGRYWISTVFLGVNILNPRLQFETAVFHETKSVEIAARYETWDDAVKGHQKVVQKYKNMIGEEYA